MLGAVITALSLVVMLLVIASLIFSAWRARQQHRRKVMSQSSSLQLPAHPLDRHVTAILYVQEGTIVNVEKPEVHNPAPIFSLSPSWYTRRRTLVSIGLLIMLLLTLFVQTSLGSGLLKATSILTLPFLEPLHAFDSHPIAHPLPDTASTRLIRVDSAMRNQYYTDYQANVWSYSSCSGIAMEMVMNAYGRHLIAADVLQKEQDLGVWSVQLGLLREEGIAMTAATFGFDASLSHTRTLQDIIDIGNKGEPVIVSVRNSYYYPNGHIFVIRGGDSQNVFIADSSLQNFQRMTHPMFTSMWQGFSAVLTPRQ